MVSSITDSTAISGGTINVIGLVNIQMRCVQWDINAAFSIETLETTSNGTGVGSYSSNLAGTGAAGATNGNSAVATFSHPIGLAIGKAGIIYVADIANNKIRKISPL